LCRFIKIIFHNKKCREGINHIVDGIKSNPIMVLNQLSGRLNVLVDGSNTENKLVIIFNLLSLL